MGARSASIRFWKNKYESMGRIREEQAGTSKESEGVDSGSAPDQEKPSTSEKWKGTIKKGKGVDFGSVPVQQELSTNEKGKGVDFGREPNQEAPGTSEKREGMDFGALLDHFDLLKKQGCGAQAGVRAILMLTSMSKRSETAEGRSRSSDA